MSLISMPECSRIRLGAVLVALGVSATPPLLADPVYPNYGFPPTNAAFPEVSGFEGFQLTAPYNTNNPFGQDDLEAIDRGFELFTTETFNGNGRTCSSCHLPDKNYNLSIEDFQGLSPADQTLVLGGTNPHLENSEAVTEAVLFNINQGAGAGTEGDIATPLGPFRSSMTIGGLGFAVLNDHVCKVGALSPATPLPLPTPPTACRGPDILVNVAGAPNNAVDDGLRDLMLGWSGEGPLEEPFPYVDGGVLKHDGDCSGIINEFAADDSSLRDLDLALATFALAAVKTHFPITQDRKPGADFDCPTKDELLDMAEFQKWLGRRFELDITLLKFKAKEAQHGRNLFSTRVATCVACHVNAGASDTQGRIKSDPVPFLTMDGHEDFEYVGGRQDLMIIGTNKTSRNGSQFLEDNVQTQFDNTLFNLPFDKGDHQLRAGNTQGGFNVQSLIEGVRNKQFFHNNGITDSIEDAIEFYFTADFKASQGGNTISNDFRRSDPHDPSTQLTGPQAREFLGGDQAIADMGLFLRSLSSLYAIADCERFIDEAAIRIELGLPPDVPANHCRFAMNDVRRMLTDVPVPKSYNHVLKDLDRIEKHLVKELEHLDNKNKKGKIGKLQALRKELAESRRSIATTPELK